MVARFLFDIILEFSDRRPGRSVLLLNNFPSEQGLGGSCELAAAKARPAARADRLSAN